MSLNTSLKSLRQSVLEAYEDAIVYFQLFSSVTTNLQERMAADLAAREFIAGVEIVDLLVDEETDSFMTPEAASDVARSLANLLEGIDQQRCPLIACRAASLIERADAVELVLDNTTEDLPECKPKTVTVH